MNLKRTVLGRFASFILVAVLSLAGATRADVPQGTLMWINVSFSSGSATAEARAVAVDKDGNTIVVGRFVGAVNFMGTNLTATSATVPSGFVAKFNSSGAVLWVIKLGSSNWTELTAVAVDPAGNIYVGGTASGAFSIGSFSLTVPSGNGQDAVVIKLDPNGNVVWGQNFGAAGTEGVFSMQYSKNGTIVFGGNFLTSITLGSNTFVTAGSNDIYIGQLVASSGAVIQSWHIGGAFSDSLSSVSVDNDGNVYVAGTFTISADFGSGTVVGPGTTCIFLVKYAPNSSVPTWYKVYSPSTLGSMTAGLTTRSNSVWLVGSFAGTQDFGGGTPLITTNGRSMYLLKLDATGNFILNKKFGDGSGANDLPRGAVVGNSGRISFTGQFKSNPSDWGSYGTTAGNGQNDSTFATTDDSGTVLWAKQILAPTASTGYAVALTANEDLIVCGFTGAGDYGGGPVAVGTAGHEMFVARYRGFGPDAAAYPTNYAAWAALHFPIQMIDDPAFGSVTSNPFGDRVVNFWKYVSNQDPWAKGTNPVTTSYATNRFSFSFPRSKAALDARAWLVSSTNLITGNWISNTTLTTTSALDANFDRVTLTDGIGVTNTLRAKFLRVSGTNGP